MAAPRIPTDFQDFLRSAAAAGTGVRITVLGEGETGIRFVARWSDREGPEVDYRCEGDALVRVAAARETKQ